MATVVGARLAGTEVLSLPGGLAGAGVLALHERAKEGQSYISNVWLIWAVIVG